MPDDGPQDGLKYVINTIKVGFDVTKYSNIVTLLFPVSCDVMLLTGKNLQ
jgi:hypothetical protein